MVSAMALAYWKQQTTSGKKQQSMVAEEAAVRGKATVHER